MFRNIHYHHTIPKSLGGENSLKIPLCGACHTSVHAKALAVYAYTNGSRKCPIYDYWDSAVCEQKATQWVTLIVKAMVSCPKGMPVLISGISVNAEIHNLLNIMKIDLSLGSLEKTLLFCIIETLKSKGYNNNDKAKESRASHRHNCSSGKIARLWGLPRS